MKRLSLVTFALALIAAGCSSSNSPAAATTPTKPTFTADLRPSNEVPPITDAESTGTGTATITLDVTRDGSNNITAATATFVVNVSGFPAGTTLRIAHIHEAPAGTNGSIVVDTTLAASDITLTNGAGSFTKAGIAVSPVDIANRILANPAGFYFNIHTVAHPAGVIRGQLVRVQ
jgi:hypothetical protein